MALENLKKDLLSLFPQEVLRIKSSKRKNLTIKNPWLVRATFKIYFVSRLWVLYNQGGELIMMRGGVFCDFGH
jgi:hypothetical protein